jgi:hypothetical protein
MVSEKTGADLSGCHSGIREAKHRFLRCQGAHGWYDEVLRGSGCFGRRYKEHTAIRKHGLRTCISDGDGA